MGEVHSVQQEIGDALIALGLEMVLGHPEAIIAQPIQRFGDRLGFIKDGDEGLVREPAVVDRCATIPDVIHINVSGKAAVKMCDHGVSPCASVRAMPWSMVKVCVASPSSQGVAYSALATLRRSSMACKTACVTATVRTLSSPSGSTLRSPRSSPSKAWISRA